MLAFNLVHRFQISTRADPPARDGKCRSFFRYLAIQSMRFMCLARAGILPGRVGKQILHVGVFDSVRDRIPGVRNRLDQFARVRSIVLPGSTTLQDAFD